MCTHSPGLQSAIQPWPPSIQLLSATSRTLLLLIWKCCTSTAFVLIVTAVSSCLLAHKIFMFTMCSRSLIIGVNLIVSLERLSGTRLCSTVPCPPHSLVLVGLCSLRLHHVVICFPPFASALVVLCRLVCWGVVHFSAVCCAVLRYLLLPVSFLMTRWLVLWLSLVLILCCCWWYVYLEVPVLCVYLIIFPRLGLGTYPIPASSTLYSGGDVITSHCSPGWSALTTGLCPLASDLPILLFLSAWLSWASSVPLSLLVSRSISSSTSTLLAVRLSSWLWKSIVVAEVSNQLPIWTHHKNIHRHNFQVHVELSNHYIECTLYGSRCREFLLCKTTW